MVFTSCVVSVKGQKAFHAECDQLDETHGAAVEENWSDSDAE